MIVTSLTWTAPTPECPHQDDSVHTGPRRCQAGPVPSDLVMMTIIVLIIMIVTSLTVVLTDLGPGGRRQGVGCEVVLGPEAEPVGGVLVSPGPQQLGGQLRSEVVLSEALHRHQVAPVTFAKI